VLIQVLWGARSSVGREVCRRGARHQPGLAELARDDVLGTCPADANAEVETFLHQIDDSIRERNIEAYLCMRGKELGKRRCQMAHAEVNRRRQLDGAARDHRRARSFLLRLLEVGKDLHAALIQRAAALGKADPACGPVQQAGLQVRLELGDMPGGSGGGQA